MSSGYSKTPLAKKLGLKAGYKIYLHDEPDDYTNLFDILPKDLVFIRSPKSESIDFIHAFFTSREALQDTIKNLKPYLNQNGILWVSWPKGTSKITSDINRESVRAEVINIGLVDIKVCAIDEDWSGLKFMYRLKDRT
ncbi:DUF3052 domain-containing protein [Winogradskyella flava]|uniref:DUF3052 domain-containing protein n=1 Tax=Winogradskyella flava TaxID=1884876 RepID=UPI00248FAB6E|nr:DUF3052 domain-containing protein [Winogradskyella flava]